MSSGSARSYRVPERIMRAPLEDEEVFLNTASSQYHLLQGSARELLQHLALGLTVDEAAARVAEATGADPEIVVEDSKVFIAQMLERGLLEPAT